MSISLVKIYYHPINNKELNKQNLLILLLKKKKKTIEEQDQKQIDALENLKDQNKQLLNVDVNDDYENKLLHSKEQEIFRKIYNKRLDKIDEVTKRLSVIISYLLH